MLNIKNGEKYTFSPQTVEKVVLPQGIIQKRLRND